MAHAHGNDHGGHHIISPKVLINTFIALLILTILTVGTSLLLHAVPSLGFLSIPLALLIAGGKATLVVLFFMGIKYDKPINGVIAVTMILFVAIFMVFTLMDTMTRKTFSQRFGTTMIEEKEMYKESESKLEEVNKAFKTVPLTPADYQQLGAAGAAKDSTGAK